MISLLDDRPALVPVEAIDVGDRIVVGGVWLTVTYIQLDRLGGRYLAAHGPDGRRRLFHAKAGTRRVAGPAHQQGDI